MSDDAARARELANDLLLPIEDEPESLEKILTLIRKIRRETWGPYTGLDKAVEKFLRDIEVIPPWQVAGAIWAIRVKELQRAWLDSKEQQATQIKEK